MKIYKRIIIDLNGNTLKEDSFEYSGPIVLAKGGTSYPEPTAEETALTEAQTELIAEQVEQLERQNELMEELWPTLRDYYTGQIEYSQLQLEAAETLLPLQTELAEQGIELNALQLDAIKSEIERNAALEPVLLEAMGYEKDESGNYVAVEGEQDPLLAQLEERYTGAIEGKEGVSPYLEKQLADERGKLEEDLSRKLGRNWQSTTPGIKALSDFDTRADLLREEAQQATIASAGSQYFQARGLMAGEQQRKVSNLLSLTGRTPTGVTPTGTAGVGMPTGGGMTGLMGGGGSSVSANISDLRNYYQQQRYSQWSARQGQRAGQSQAMMGGVLGGATIGAQVGTTAGLPGIAIGAGAGLLAGYLLS
jgi:hypothetical protein